MKVLSKGALAGVTVSLALNAACSDDAASAGGGEGSLQIFVVPEETITEGLQSGEDLENVRDGWTITYDKWLVGIGHFHAASTASGGAVSDDGVHLLDLRNAPSDGYLVKTFDGLAAERWDKFGYRIEPARLGAVVPVGTPQADVDLMFQNEYSVYFEGKATKDTKTISFKWGFKGGTSFDDCATDDGQLGFAVPKGGSVQVKPTIHGDHQFFSNVTQGVELTERLAGWIAVCDAGDDGELTLDDLKACDASTALPQPPYDLTAVKDQDGDGKITVYDYVDTQIRTIGDYQGDGECPTRAKTP